MANIKLNATALSKIYLGTSEITKAYLGTSIIYEVGGGEPTSRLYACDLSNDVYLEIDPSTAIIINNVASSDGYPSDIGGITGRLFSTTTGTGAYGTYELDLDTLIQTNFVSNSTRRYGIGGITTRLYAMNTDFARTHEIDPDTLLEINTLNSKPNTQCWGLGGSDTSIYTLRRDNPNYIWELDLDTLAPIRTQTSSGLTSYCYSIGGIGTSLYTIRQASDTLYELDESTLLIIDSTVLSSTSYSITGTGTTKV